MKKILYFCSLAIILALNISAQENAKPFVIPELRQWSGKSGDFSLTPESSLVIDAKAGDKLEHIANLFSKDIKTMFGKDIAVRKGDPKAGDIYLTVGQTGSDNKESYKLNIEDIVRLTGKEETGVFWGTRTLLQILEQSDKLVLPKGETLDFPKYEVRGFMLDCGRKFFRIGFLRDYVKFMSYYKMNTFQIHLNDSSNYNRYGRDWSKVYAAFRLESDTYPGLTAQDGHYTKKEFIDLQKLAEDLYVNIIPEIDVPSHSLAFSRYKPEIGSAKYGMDHLDLFNPETYNFVDGLFKEYLEGPNPVFRGKQVNIGTDEYSNKDREVVEKFRYFTDRYIRYVEQFGKQAVVWGALTHAKGETPVKVDNVIMNIWHNPYAQPRDMAKLGYKMISIPDGLLYIVPQAGYYYNYLNTHRLYNNWEPRFIGKEEFEDGDPQVLGGMFAVWNDHVGNGISEKDVHHRVWPAMQTLAVKMWAGNGNLIPVEEFDKKRELLSEAPGVNIMGRVKGKTGVVLEKDELTAGEATGMEEIGYNYRVDFKLNALEAAKGTTLFESPHATVYLADPKNGLLGFAREGYLFTFDYAVPVGDKKEVSIAIEGDSKSTRLYVNGELRQTLDISSIVWTENGKFRTALVRTLVFPLEKAGNFKGKIKNLKVTVL